MFSKFDRRMDGGCCIML